MTHDLDEALLSGGPRGAACRRVQVAADPAAGRCSGSLRCEAVREYVAGGAPTGDGAEFDFVRNGDPVDRCGMVAE